MDLIKTPHLLLSAASILIFCLMFSNIAEAQNMSPVGVWKTIDDTTGQAKSLVKISEKNGKLYGTIIKLINPPEPNPICGECTGNLYNKPILGMTVLSGLKKDGSEWNGGTILDPENGKTYKVLIEVLPGDKKLKVRGYIGISLIGRSQQWLRVK